MWLVARGLEDLPRAERRASAISLLLAQVQIAEAQDAAHVLGGLREGRDAAVLVDRLLAGVVRGQRQAHVAAVAVEQVAQVADATLDVLSRLEASARRCAGAPSPA